MAFDPAKNILRTTAGDPVPQIWDDVNEVFIVYEGDVSVIASALPTGAATQSTLASLLAKVISAPSTEAKQDTLIAKDFATQTTLAALLAKVIASPATEAKQDTLIAKDFATQTTLAAVLAKIISAPATEAKQDTLIAKDFATQTTLNAVKTAVEGVIDTQLTNNQVVEVLTEADATGSPAVTLTFSANINAIEIYHNEATVQNFTVNGITLVIARGGWRSPVGGTAATTVTIPETVDCVVSRLV